MLHIFYTCMYIYLAVSCSAFNLTSFQSIAQSVLPLKRKPSAPYTHTKNHLRLFVCDAIDATYTLILLYDSFTVGSVKHAATD